ncbi:MAG: hypothetical protein ABSH00_05885 [Bryobacteraceae bacterium]|jgi:uncharacterized protein (TIGR03437 family)
MNRHIRNVAILLLAAYPVVVRAADNSYLNNLPTGARWLEHLNNDLLPFWTIPPALGDPLGSFPSERCDDGSLLNYNNPCWPIAGNASLLIPAQYLVPLSRQTYGYGVAYHLTGNSVYLDYMKAGVAYLRQNCIDPNGGMFESQDLTTGVWGPNILYRDPQQLGYGLLGMAFYYYLTRDDAVLQDILTIKDYIWNSYYNQSLGTNQWLLADDDGTMADSKQLVADLDEMNTYLVLLTPLLPEPYQSQWMQTMTLDAQSILGTFYSPQDNLFFLAADTPQEMDLNYTGVDVGHSSKALWMLRWAGLLTGDQGLASFAGANGRRLLDRAYMPESATSGSWAQGVLQGGAQDPDKTWWISAELDQLSGTLALSDVAAGSYLPQTTAYWFNYFVDHQYGEVWNGLNYPDNSPQRSYPKTWQWKSAYHDFEHTLVGYITSQWLLGQPVTLYYAFGTTVDESTIHPYYFSSTIDSLTQTQDSQGNSYQAVTFHPVSVGSAPPVVATSAASFLASPLAAGSIATLWGTDLPTGATGANVSVTDVNGASRQAQVFYASPSQINFLIPAGTAAGAATITVTSPAGTSASASATAQIVSVSPGIFQLNSTALAAAEVQRVNADQSQSIGPVYQLGASNNVTPLPISVDPANGAVYLWVFATGLQNAQSVAVTVGGQQVPVKYHGAQGTYNGLDQVNVGPLPPSLAGSGRVNIVLTADGQTANPVEIFIQ